MSQTETVTLKKEYPSIYGVPVINRIDPAIFQIKYFTNCLECDFCHDICCSSGVDIDIENVKRILKYGDQIEREIKIKRTGWFTDKYNEDPEFPGGKYKRTKVKEGTCVFLDMRERGCLLHRFCIRNNIDYHILKPLVSILFPITFDKGTLFPSTEVRDNSLICLNKGATLYRGNRYELEYYFGKEFINEADKLETVYLK